MVLPVFCLVERAICGRHVLQLCLYRWERGSRRRVLRPAGLDHSQEGGRAVGRERVRVGVLPEHQSIAVTSSGASMASAFAVRQPPSLLLHLLLLLLLGRRPLGR